jgi:uncharacterized damage-inducible protein DinB
MNERALLGDAFGHHGWATLQLIDACGMLTSEQLDTSVAGTYGSILDTMRHLVGSDASYLHVCSGGRVERIDPDAMDLRQLRDAAERHAHAWLELLDASPDPSAVLVRHRDDGSETHAPLSVRLAQALHHGTDHRSQVCTTLTSLDIEPPEIDVWDYARQAGLLHEVPPPA